MRKREGKGKKIKGLGQLMTQIPSPSHSWKASHSRVKIPYDLEPLSLFYSTFANLHYYSTRTPTQACATVTRSHVPCVPFCWFAMVMCYSTFTTIPHLQYFIFSIQNTRKAQGKPHRRVTNRVAPQNVTLSYKRGRVAVSLPGAQ